MQITDERLEQLYGYLRIWQHTQKILIILQKEGIESLEIPFILDYMTNLENLERQHAEGIQEKH